VVLAGGRSARYGTDKAFALVDGVPMVRLVADALVSGGITDVIVLGGDATALRALGLSVVADLHPGDGPLGALLTAFDVTTAGVVVLAACDLPSLSGGHVRRMLDALADEDDAAAAVPCTDRLEPLGGATYRVDRCADRFRLAFERGERSLQRVLDGLTIVSVDTDPAVLLNVNRPGDRPSSR
jgi:molybdopterin-guanine dinucleotide biosynthesis protein A